MSVTSSRAAYTRSFWAALLLSTLPFALFSVLALAPFSNHNVSQLSQVSAAAGDDDDDNDDNDDGSFTNPLQFDTIDELLVAILRAVILIAFPIIVLFLVLSGFKFITAQGNPQAIAEARKLFFFTLVGALLVLGAQALSYAIKETVDALRV